MIPLMVTLFNSSVVIETWDRMIMRSSFEELLNVICNWVKFVDDKTDTLRAEKIQNIVGEKLSIYCYTF